MENEDFSQSSSGEENEEFDSEDERNEFVIPPNSKDIVAVHKALGITKEDDLTYDLGYLAVYDNHPINEKEFKRSKEKYLNQLAKENSQLLITKIFQLPKERIDNILVANLPDPLLKLPREKPVPQPKPPTKWEKFAKEKGIVKRKRSKKVWDDQKQDWAPRFGYKRANDDTKDWLIEVKPSDTDPFEDPFKKRDDEKKERISKQEKRRMKNEERAQAIRDKKQGLVTSSKAISVKQPSRKQKEMEIERALAITKNSTASVGKFQPGIAGEKMEKLNTRRQFKSVAGDIGEHDTNKKIMDRVLNKGGKTKLNVQKLANSQVASEQRKRSGAPMKGKKGKKRRR